jgi:hypothetical protein
MRLEDGRETPDDFRFIARVPKQATDRDLIWKFLEGLAAIEEKVLTVVLQVLQSLALIEGREWLDDLLGSCAYHGYSTAIELGYPSWFQDIAYNILRRHGAALVWSDMHRHMHPGAQFGFCVPAPVWQQRQGMGRKGKRAGRAGAPRFCSDNS